MLLLRSWPLIPAVMHWKWCARRSADNESDDPWGTREGIKGWLESFRFVFPLLTLERDSVCPALTYAVFTTTKLLSCL